MGRRRTIDRERVLDAAEHLVATEGASALTIAAVAKAAGITKGGVQSCFGTKEALITAMIQHWMDDHDQRLDRHAEGGQSPAARVSAHIDAIMVESSAAHTRASGLLAVLLQQPEHLTIIRRWYSAQLHGLEDDSTSKRRARVAFFAAEGAFLLRYFGFLPFSESEWNQTFESIKALLASD